MNRVLIIARQEFMKFVTRRGFLFTLIGVPLWIALAVVVPPMLAKSEAPQQTVFTVIDRSGAYGDILAQDARKPDAESLFTFVEPPAVLAMAPPGRFAVAAKSILAAGGLDAIIVIPKDFDATHPAQMWSLHDDPDLRNFVRSHLTDALRLRNLHALDPTVTATLFETRAKLELRKPAGPPGDGVAKSVSLSVGIGAAILLLIVAMMNSAALLQGVIEEKSTRMVEVLLSCATPWEIVSGKILGVVAVALFTVFLWVGSAAFLGSFFAGHAVGGFIAAALRLLANPALFALIVIYFLCGLLIYGAIFLSIGSMSASLADAQAYLGPSMMIIMLPNLFIGGVLRDPNGPMAVAASYFPIYTPYIMLMRVPSHPPALQVVTTIMLSLSATILLVLGAGTVFARHALTTEKMSVKRLFGRSS